MRRRHSPRFFPVSIVPYQDEPTAGSAMQPHAFTVPQTRGPLAL